MNVDRILQLADVVEKGHHKFNGVHAALYMGEWIIPIVKHHYDEEGPRFLKRGDIEQPHECNTAACIAGFACLLWEYNKYVGYVNPNKNYPDKSPRLRAQDLLELDDEQADLLFVGYTDCKITGPQAARVLRELAETGIVNWRPIEREHYPRDFD